MDLSLGYLQVIRLKHHNNLEHHLAPTSIVFVAAVVNVVHVVKPGLSLSLLAAHLHSLPSTRPLCQRFLFFSSPAQHVSQG